MPLYVHRASARVTSFLFFLIISRVCHGGKVYNNIIVSNDSNEEDALLNSAVESSGNHPEGHEGGSGGGGGGHASNSSRGGQLKHEAASGGPSSGSKDIVLSTNGSKTKIIVRKAKGSAKRSALDSYRRTHSRSDGCPCSGQKSPPSDVKQVIFVPFCGPEPHMTPESANQYSQSTQFTHERDEGNRRLDFAEMRPANAPYFIDPLTVAGLSPMLPFSQAHLAAQLAALRAHEALKMRAYRASRSKRPPMPVPPASGSPGKTEPVEMDELEPPGRRKVTIGETDSMSSNQFIERRKHALTPEEETRRILEELHFRQAYALH